jgi:hypothetical protein
VPVRVGWYEHLPAFKIQQAVEKLRFANFGERMPILYIMVLRGYELVHAKNPLSDP